MSRCAGRRRASFPLKQELVLGSGRRFQRDERSWAFLKMSPVPQTPHARSLLGPIDMTLTGLACNLVTSCDVAQGGVTSACQCTYLTEVGNMAVLDTGSGSANQRLVPGFTGCDEARPFVDGWGDLCCRLSILGDISAAGDVQGASPPGGKLLAAQAWPLQALLQEVLRGRSLGRGRGRRVPLRGARKTRRRARRSRARAASPCRSVPRSATCMCGARTYSTGTWHLLSAPTCDSREHLVAVCEGIGADGELHFGLPRSATSRSKLRPPQSSGP